MDPHKRQALVLLIGSIFDQLDEIAILKKRGNKAQISTELLKEMTSVVPELSPELQQAYFDLMVRLGSVRLAPLVSSISDDFVEMSKEKKLCWLQNVKKELIAA